jgi:hypothetical protein
VSLHPRILTPQRRAKLLECARAGCHPDVCAARAKMSPITLARWLDRGRAEVTNREDELAPFDPLNPRLDELSALGLFAVEFDAASAEHEVGLVTEILADPGPGDRRWILERRYPARWGAKQSVELSGPDKGPIEVSDPRDALIKRLFVAADADKSER